MYKLITQSLRRVVVTDTQLHSSRGGALLASMMALMLLAPLLPLRAQQRPDTTVADSTRIGRLPPVVTTATRAAARADELPQRVQTITRAALERTPVTDLVDALKKLAGVDVVQYPSLLGGIGIRGFRPTTGGVQQRVLVLLDGRPSGAYNLALLDLGNVERIEVLRGPASALYGSGAVGGVVNVITRDSREGVGGAGSASYGTFHRSELAARAGGSLIKNRAFDADLSVRRYQQGANYRTGSGTLLRDLVGGDNAVKIYTGTTKPPREVPDTASAGLLRDYTTFTTTSGSARLGIGLVPRFRVNARVEGFHADDVLSPGDVYSRLSQFPGNGRKNVARRSEDLTVGTDAETCPKCDSLAVSHSPLLRLYNSQERSDAFNDPGKSGYVNYRSIITTSGAQAQDVLTLGVQSLTAGVDGSRVESTSNRYSQTNGLTQEIGTYSPNSRLSSEAAFGEAHVHSASGTLTATLGARVDRMTLEVLATPYRPDVTGGRTHFLAFNPSAGPQLALMRGLRVHATAGRAFVAPDAFGMAGFAQSVTNGAASITVGNPALRAEHSTSVDGGVSLSPGYVSELEADLTVFHTEVLDRITSVRATFASGQRPTLADGTQVSSISTSVNAGRAHLHGVEAHLSYDIGRALGRAMRLAVFVDGTRLLRAEEVTPAVRVDTTSFAAMRDLDARRVFSAIVLGPGQTTLRIKNVAKVTSTFGVDYDDFRRVLARLSGRYVGRRLDTDLFDSADPSDIEYPPFMVLDITVGVRLVERYRVEGIVSNLTDENYYEKRGYNLAGRTVNLRLSTTF